MKSHAGVTLVELLLYIALISVVVFSISAFMFLTLQSRIKNESIAEVEQQGLQAMQMIAQIVRNSTSLNFPIQAGSADNTSINVSVPANSPTIFSLSSGQIMMQEGATGAIALTNSRVDVTGLVFQNLSPSATSEILRVSFTVASKNPGGRNEYDYSKTFFTSAQLRP